MSTKLCLVIMPFKSHQTYLDHRRRYEQIIRRAVNGLKEDGRQLFRCERADDAPETGSITDHLVRQLQRADVVIADLTDDNPNVFYELGIRHTLRPGTVLLAKDARTLPFDVSHQHVICYGEQPKAKTISAIQGALTALYRNPAKLDSPVLTALSSPDRYARGVPLDWIRKGGRFVSPIPGIWLEILDRREDERTVRHFSFFRLRYDQTHDTSPLVMEGLSFRANQELHSRWSTTYLKVKTGDRRDIVVEYIYEAEVGRARRTGYGVSTFHLNGKKTCASGHGYYLAGEEDSPYQCNYRLQRLGAKLISTLGTAQPFSEEHLRKLVPGLAREFKGGRLDGRSRAEVRQDHFDAALEEARKGLAEHGIPIGSVLTVDGKIVGRGHNRRVQNKSAVLHAEMDCLERAGRLRADEYRRAVLYSTLSPCDMCTGAILLYRIPTVIIGENQTFKGPEELLTSRGTAVHVVNDPRCVSMMRTFIRRRPDLWHEDIGEP